MFTDTEEEFNCILEAIQAGPRDPVRGIPHSYGSKRNAISPVLLIHRDPASLLQPAEEQFLCPGLPLDPIPTVLQPAISSEATRNKIPGLSLLLSFNSGFVAYRVLQ